MGALRVQFGDRVRALRKWKGMTQEELAEAANLSVDFIGLIERGVNAPSFDSIEQLASALGVEVRELFEFSRGERKHALDE